MAGTIKAELTSDKKSNWCSIHTCQTKIKAGETYFRLIVWMGGAAKKYVRVCKKCLVSRAQEYISTHPEFKQEVLENNIGGN